MVKTSGMRVQVKHEPSCSSESTTVVPLRGSVFPKDASDLKERIRTGIEKVSTLMRLYLGVV